MNGEKQEIRIEVSLDEKRRPSRIEWTATDGAAGSEAKAMFLSLWDGGEGDALRIDLWTPEMKVEEMRAFMHRHLLTLADTFERATGEKRLTEDLREYCGRFAEAAGLQQDA